MRPLLPALLSTTLLLALPAAAHEPFARVRVAFDRDGITASEAHGLAVEEAIRQHGYALEVET